MRVSPFASALGMSSALQIGDQLRRRKRHRLQCQHLTRLDLRVIEQIGDQPQEMLGIDGDTLRRLGAADRSTPSLWTQRQHLDLAQDADQRRAQFVRHHRDEVAL